MFVGLQHDIMTHGATTNLRSLVLRTFQPFWIDLHVILSMAIRVPKQSRSLPHLVSTITTCITIVPVVLAVLPAVLIPLPGPVDLRVRVYPSSWPSRQWVCSKKARQPTWNESRLTGSLVDPIEVKCSSLYKSLRIFHCLLLDTPRWIRTDIMMHFSKVVVVACLSAHGTLTLKRSVPISSSRII